MENIHKDILAYASKRAENDEIKGYCKAIKVYQSLEEILEFFITAHIKNHFNREYIKGLFSYLDEEKKLSWFKQEGYIIQKLNPTLFIIDYN